MGSLPPTSDYAYAVEGVSKIGMHLTFEDNVKEGIILQIYKVGELLDDGETVCAYGDFEDCYSQLPLDDVFQLGTDSAYSQWKQELEDFIVECLPSPLRIARSDPEGFVEFDGLIDGFYLITGEPFNAGRFTYQMVSKVIEIRHSDMDNDYCKEIDVSTTQTQM